MSGSSDRVEALNVLPKPQTFGLKVGDKCWSLDFLSPRIYLFEQSHSCLDSKQLNLP